MIITEQKLEDLLRAGRTALTEIESKQLVADAGIPVAETKLARSRAQAVAISRALGVPVVLKVISPDIVHKSEMGGVRLNLTTPREVGKAYDDILSRAKCARPEATIEGVSVQPMARPGTELIIGMYKDAQFGPVVMFGLGGVFVEVLKDVSFRIVPLSARDCDEMIQEIKAYPILQGYRQREAVNLAALQGILLKLSHLAERRPEIKEIDLNPIFAYRDGAFAADARVILESKSKEPDAAEVQERRHRKSLSSIFEPRSIAMLGDSEGYGPIWEMRLRIMSSYTGKLYVVQEKAESPWPADMGAEVYPSLAEIPGQVDCVIAGLSPSRAPTVVKDCVQKAVSALVYLTPGFAETGEVETQGIQEKMAQMARENDLLLLGPNCWGVYNPMLGIRQNGDQSYGHGGSVGFISQSGELCTRFGMIGAYHGIKISKSVAYGNAIVLESTDCLEYLADDHDTSIIAMNIEFVRDGARFFRTLREVAEKKPVLVWKAGQTKAGARATASHTGAIAQSTKIWPHLIGQCGAIAINSIEELIDTAKGLLYLRPTTGERVGIITVSGGDMVVTAESFERAGLDVPVLTEPSLREAAKLISVGGHTNPFDMSGNFVMQGGRLGGIDEALDIMDRDPNIDWVVLNFYTQIFRLIGMPDDEIPDANFRLLSDFHRRATKPFVLVLNSRPNDDVMVGLNKRVLDAGIPIFNLEGAAKAVKNIAEYHRFHQLKPRGLARV